VLRPESLRRGHPPASGVGTEGEQVRRWLRLAQSLFTPRSTFWINPFGIVTPSDRRRSVNVRPARAPCVVASKSQGELRNAISALVDGSRSRPSGAWDLSGSQFAKRGTLNSIMSERI
jgi:hypothetical protein